MKKLLLQTQDKKGVSEMVGYVLLVIIAVGLSVLVYSYLKIYVPNDKLSCNKEVYLTLDDYTCTILTETPLRQGSLNIILSNRGLFDVDAVYLRFGPKNKKILTFINDPNNKGDPDVNIRPDQFYLRDNNGQTGLPPGGKFENNYVVPLTDPQTAYSLEIEPAIFSDEFPDRLALCPQAIIRTDINCLLPTP